MIQISIPWMLNVVASLNRLDNIPPNGALTDVFIDLFDAQQQLETLFNQSVYGPYLRASRERANVLHQAIERILAITEIKWNDPVPSHNIFEVKTASEQFRLVFLSEISTLPVFLVSKHDNYDMNLLIEAGTGLFPPTMVKKVPESYADAMEAGRALAFSMGTACGFHTFRVTECVLKRYWDCASGGAARPSLQTIGSYSAELERQSFGEKKVIESLKQFSKLHRNPCIHPEVILSVEEAIGTLGIARSVIAAMLSVMPDVPPTTGTARTTGAAVST